MVIGIYPSGGGGGGNAKPYQETPAGAINGVNKNYTISTAVSDSASFELFLSGRILKQGATQDYTISGTSITMAVAPLPGQTLYAVWNTPAAGSANFITAVSNTDSIALTVTSQTLTADFRFGYYGSRAAPVAISAVGGLPFSGTQLFSKAYIAGNGGAVIVTANPQIAAGSVDGQELTIQSRSNLNTVRFNDGNGLVLNGAWIGQGDSVLTLTWDGTNWVEKCRQ